MKHAAQVSLCSVCAFVCVRMYICVCVFVCIYICMWVYIYIVYMYVCMYILTHTYTLQEREAETERKKNNFKARSTARSLYSHYPYCVCVKLIAFELAAKFSRRRENPVQPRLCNAKKAIFKRLKTGVCLRSRSSPANPNAIISFMYIFWHSDKHKCEVHACTYDIYGCCSHTK
jgi:hypothetical protein